MLPGRLWSLDHCPPWACPAPHRHALHPTSLPSTPEARSAPHEPVLHPTGPSYTPQVHPTPHETALHPAGLPCTQQARPTPYRHALHPMRLPCTLQVCPASNRPILHPLQACPGPTGPPAPLFPGIRTVPQGQCPVLHRSLAQKPLPGIWGCTGTRGSCALAPVPQADGGCGLQCLRRTRAVGPPGRRGSPPPSQLPEPGGLSPAPPGARWAEAHLLHASRWACSAPGQPPPLGLQQPRSAEARATDAPGGAGKGGE